MIRITQLKLPPDAGSERLENEIRNILHLKEHEVFSYEVLRRSVDARKKPDLHEVYTVCVDLHSPHAEKRILSAKRKNVEPYEIVRYRYSAEDGTGKILPDSSGISGPPESETDSAPDSREYRKEYVSDPDRPLIIGTGPAGLFCGLLLAREGLRPILIERGQRAVKREKSVHSFWREGELNPESNVQFGEGGAGTFSDGKLNTGVKDPEGRIRFILNTFVQAGADPSVLYDTHPHVGTDILKNVVTTLTDEIAGRGGDVYFETRMDRIRRDPSGIWQVMCKRTGDRGQKSDGNESLCFSTRHLVLAIGHSARDTFTSLNDSGILMYPKAFAVGVRILHPQNLIDNALYGDCPYHMPPAPYKLTHRLKQGRGVYSFCMCPGGYVVNASSEEKHLAVNGMSYSDRASGSANSAVVVTVSPEEILQYNASLINRSTQSALKDNTVPRQEDFEKKDALIGMRFQRNLEKAAFEAGGGAIPVQRFGDFSKKLSGSTRSYRNMPDFEPRICGKWLPSPIRHIYPEFIADGIEEGILAWERQISGFSHPDTLLCAVESRTSSPVRIERGEDFQATGHPGLYPCGEGAGYAGGITSAAADGLRVAEQILRLLE